MRRLLFLFFIAISCKQTTHTVANDVTLRPPNIILIFTDDQGYRDVGVFGSAIKTPNLDTLAKQGARLTNFYAAQAVCSASRAGILTGCYPNRIGIHGALGPKSKKGINSSETTIAEMLKSKGYQTAIFGKWHLGHLAEFMPTKHGFDEFFGIPYSNDMWPFHPQQGKIFDFPPLPLYENEKVVDTLVDQTDLTVQITDKSVDFIERNQNNPFFMYVAHPQPHVPLFVSERFKGKSKQGLYGDVIMELDWSVGQILESLQANGISKNTLVIFTSDNGPWLSYGNHAGSAYPLREGKGTAWEGGQREPFIAYYPDHIPAGTVIEAPVMAIDLMPTMAAVSGAELPKTKIDGKSAWPVLQGKTKESPQEAYFFYYRVNELHAVRYGRWKLYFPHRYRTMDGQEPGQDGKPGIYRQESLDKMALYDLNNDIGETENVLEQNPEIVKKIIQIANEKRQELGDSLLGMEGTETRQAGMIK